MGREGEPKGPLGQPRPEQEHETPREAVLRRGIDALQRFYDGASGPDRSQSLVVRYFLQSFFRTPQRSLHDAALVLDKKVHLPEISDELRDVFLQIAGECTSVQESDGGTIVLPAFSGEPLEDVSEPATVSEDTPPDGIASITAQQLGSKGDRYSFGSLGALFSSGEDVIGAEAEAKQRKEETAIVAKRKHFVRVFTTAREFAKRFVDRAIPADLDTEQLAERISDLEHTLLECEAYLYEHFGFPAMCIRNSATEEFFLEYFTAAKAAGAELHEFDSKVNDYIGVRARLGVLLNRVFEAPQDVAKATPEQILGVKSDATQAEIEQKYLLRLQVLNPDLPEDFASIRMLHEARDRVMERFEHTILSKSPMPPLRREESEGLLARTLRAPGKLLRTLFGVAALGAATGVAVHQFAENDSDEPKVVDVAPKEDEKVDLSGFETQSTAPIERAAAPEQREAKPSLNEVVLERGDSVWKIVIGMLRDRGLSTSNAQVQYFTHQALVDNGWTALSALEKKPGEKLDVTNIAHMMDAAAGGGDVAEVMEAPVSSAPISSEERASFSGIEEVPSLLGYGSGNAQDWLPNLVVSTPKVEKNIPVIAEVKPYSELPSADRTEHVMVKGESIYKLVHNMLRSRGLNWTTERINFLTQLVVDKNVDRFREMVADGRMRKMDEVWIPAGAVLDFSDAVAVVDEMERAKQAGKKAKTVKELAQGRSYKYPIMMKFPKE